MRIQPSIRAFALLAPAACVLCAACGGNERQDSGGGANRPVAAPASESPNEVPAAKLAEFLKHHYAGLGAMERYEYAPAAQAFRAALETAPGYHVAKINLAIALLNMTGEEAEKSKKSGAGPSRSNFVGAIALLDEVVAADPENLHARFCRGVINSYLGEFPPARADFTFVTEKDPNDANAWLGLGAVSLDNPADKEQYKVLVECYTNAVELNPYLVTAWYRLSRAQIALGEKQKYDDSYALWKKLKPDDDAAIPGDREGNEYGIMGKYATVIDPFKASRAPAAKPGPPPKFAAATAIDAALPEGHRWAKRGDFQGKYAIHGRVRDRFGAALAALDVNSDGKLDLYLCAAVAGPNGLRDVLLLNNGSGHFNDASATYGLPAERASIGVAAGDFDADNRIDLFLTNASGNHLLRNTGGKFEDVTKILGPPPDRPALSLAARWFDIDQDGDLDLYVINYCHESDAERAFAAAPVAGMPNSVFRNDGKPAPVGARPESNWAPLAVATEDVPATEGLSLSFSSWTAPALADGDRAHTGIAALDVDNDRDIDFVITADDGRAAVILNDRLGRFRTAEVHAFEASSSRRDLGINGVLAVDLDRDGRCDLAFTTADGRAVLILNQTQRGSGGRPKLEFKPIPSQPTPARALQVTDLDFDGRLDLLGLPVSNNEKGLAPVWFRESDESGANGFAASDLALGPEGIGPLVALTCADFAGDPVPDLLLVRDGEAPRLAQAASNGNQWLSLSLAGRWKFGRQGGPMRTNPQGLGCRLALQSEGLYVPYDHLSPTTGFGQSVAPFVLGLGPRKEAQLVRLVWPDGTIQCEMNQPANQAVTLTEYCRRTGSCPVLFTFNGEEFVCIGDFLGGGGLGYLVAPGQYGEPDRDESVAIASSQLRPADGVFRMAIAEPMDEVSYLDKIELDAIDLPPGVSATPDERFAPGGNRPTGEVVAWKDTIEFENATDLSGRDVSRTLRRRDRQTVDGFKRLGAWIGYAEEHGIVLNFGDRLSGFGPNDRLILCLAGWVEYPYSQTNYAASTAGVALRPPILERLQDDGEWKVIEADPGYPAGLPRMTTLDLTGKLAGRTCVIRLRTNMECYYDQAFVAVMKPDLDVKSTRLAVARATLRYRGYLREVTPDGRPPLLYAYEQVDPAPLARLEGKLTRYGDVASLLKTDDDQLCVIGPGDELQLEFDAGGVPALAEGWTRMYVLRAAGYCKDADPFTAASDTIAPLPYRGMPPYPFDEKHARPEDAAYREYLRTHQTRESR